MMGIENPRAPLGESGNRVDLGVREARRRLKFFSGVDPQPFSAGLRREDLVLRPNRRSGRSVDSRDWCFLRDWASASVQRRWFSNGSEP